MGIRIASVAMEVPLRVETADQLALRIDRSPEWIAERTGVLRRHVADDDVDPADLAASAARKVLGQCGPVDLVLYAGSLPRQLIPDTSVFVHRALGLDPVPCFTVNQTCLSFLAALQVSQGLLAAGSYRRVLICTAELATRGRNFHEPESAALLGDGAAAAVVENADDTQSELIRCELATWSQGADMCVVRGGGVHPPPNAEPLSEQDCRFQMQGPPVYRMVRQRLQEFVTAFLQRAGVSIDEIDLVVPHQASGPGLRLLEQLGFAPQRTVNIVGEYGNCVAASIPMALATAVEQQRLARGQTVLLLGTAAGISLGAGLLRW